MDYTVAVVKFLSSCSGYLRFESHPTNQLSRIFLLFASVLQDSYRSYTQNASSSRFLPRRFIIRYYSHIKKGYKNAVGKSRVNKVRINQHVLKLLRQNSALNTSLMSVGDLHFVGMEVGNSASWII
jgi:hypothetical protein